MPKSGLGTTHNQRFLYTGPKYEKVQFMHGVQDVTIDMFNEPVIILALSWDSATCTILFADGHYQDVPNDTISVRSGPHATEWTKPTIEEVEL